MARRWARVDGSPASPCSTAGRRSCSFRSIHTAPPPAATHHWLDCVSPRTAHGPLAPIGSESRRHVPRQSSARSPRGPLTARRPSELGPATRPGCGGAGPGPSRRDRNAGVAAGWPPGGRGWPAGRPPAILKHPWGGKNRETFAMLMWTSRVLMVAMVSKSRIRLRVCPVLRRVGRGGETRRREAPISTPPTEARGAGLKWEAWILKQLV